MLDVESYCIYMNDYLIGSHDFDRLILYKDVWYVYVQVAVLTLYTPCAAANNRLWLE